MDLYGAAEMQLKCLGGFRNIIGLSFHRCEYSYKTTRFACCASLIVTGVDKLEASSVSSQPHFYSDVMAARHPRTIVETYAMGTSQSVGKASFQYDYLIEDVRKLTQSLPLWLARSLPEGTASLLCVRLILLTNTYLLRVTMVTKLLYLRHALQCRHIFHGTKSTSINVVVMCMLQSCLSLW